MKIYKELRKKELKPQKMYRTKGMLVRKIADPSSTDMKIDKSTWDIWKKERKTGLKLAGDEKSFDDAFKFIRDNYGKDAIFIWKGKKYNTKRKGE
tara:strand:+ start:2947 stop:3231 length:285 start_codon:yes stop_codon:yes gene_type:complete